LHRRRYDVWHIVSRWRLAAPLARVAFNRRAHWAKSGVTDMLKSKRIIPRSSPSPLPPVHEAVFIAGAAASTQLPISEGPEFAFAGRSNVGKSSLLNAVLGRTSLVRTSRTPGCTRQINFFRVRAEGLAGVFVDLPGYGYAQRSRDERSAWATLIEDYLENRKALVVVFVLVDARRGLEEHDRMLLEFLRASRAEGATMTRVVATKLDKVPSSSRLHTLKRIQSEAGLPVLGTSAVTREGLHDLWRDLRDRATCADAKTGT